MAERTGSRESDRRHRESYRAPSSTSLTASRSTASSGCSASRSHPTGSGSTRTTPAGGRRSRLALVGTSSVGRSTRPQSCSTSFSTTRRSSTTVDRSPSGPMVSSTGRSATVADAANAQDTTTRRGSILRIKSDARRRRRHTSFPQPTRSWQGWRARGVGLRAPQPLALLVRSRQSGDLWVADVGELQARGDQPAALTGSPPGRELRLAAFEGTWCTGGTSAPCRRDRTLSTSTPATSARRSSAGSSTAARRSQSLQWASTFSATSARASSLRSATR